MDVGHAAGAANAAAVAAHVAPAQAPVDEFVAKVDAATESSTDANQSRSHAQQVLARGEGHKHGVIKHLSDDDLAALVSMANVLDASAQVNAAVDETQVATPDLVEDVANRAENASAFSERVTQNLLAEVARREAAAPEADPVVVEDAEAPASPVAEASSEAAGHVDLSAKNFPDPTLATLLAEMAQFEAPDATQAAQLA